MTSGWIIYRDSWYRGRANGIVLGRYYVHSTSISGVSLECMPSVLVIKRQWQIILFLIVLLIVAIVLAGRQEQDGMRQHDLDRQDIQELNKDKKELQKDIKTLNKKLVAKKAKAKKLAEAKKKQVLPAPVVAYIPPPVSSPSNLRAIVYAAFWPDSRIDRLISCESGWNVKATGYDGAPYYQYNYGLFQVSDNHGYSATYLYNPTNNAKVARQIYNTQGWGAWPTCSRIAGLI